jgi:hypothetical protein
MHVYDGGGIDKRFCNRMGKSKLEKTEQFISVSQPTNQQKKKHKENELKSKSTRKKQD